MSGTDVRGAAEDGEGSFGRGLLVQATAAVAGARGIAEEVGDHAESGGAARG